MAVEVEVPGTDVPVLAGSVSHPDDRKNGKTTATVDRQPDPSPGTNPLAEPATPAATTSPAPDPKAPVPSPKTDPLPTPAAPTTEPAKVTPPVDLAEELNKRTKGKIKSLEELDVLLTAPREEFANPAIKGLNEWVKKGGREEDYYRTQRLDVAKLSDADVVKTQMAMEDPDLSADEVELLFQDQYKLDPDKYTEEERKLSELKLKRQAKTDRTKLNEFKAAHAVPEAEKVRLRAEEAQTQWEQDVETFNTGFAALELDIPVGEKGEVSKLNFPVDNKDQVAQIMKNPNLFFQEFVNPDGSPNLQKFREVVTIATNLGKYNAEVARLAKGTGIQDVVDQVKNTTLSSDKTPPAALSEDEITARNFAAAMRAKGH